MSDTDLFAFWHAEYLNRAVALCGLCGNTGRIDTRGRAISPAGVDAGGVYACICPNGRALHKTEAHA